MNVERSATAVLLNLAAELVLQMSSKFPSGAGFSSPMPNL